MITLLNMPFSSLLQPSLALSQFKAQLLDAGLACRLLNLNFAFAERIGFTQYEPLAKRFAVDMRIGEWFFAGEAWGADCCRDLRPLLAACQRGGGQFGSLQQSEEWLFHLRDQVVPAFLDDCLARLFAQAPPAVVAFSCVFFQTIPALALARRIKARAPEVKIVVGGACLHAEMGREIFAKAPWLDCVSIGEADDIVVALFSALAAGQDPAELNGILYRPAKGAPPRHAAVAQPVSAEVLEALPDPDFDDFLWDVEQLRKRDAHFRASPVFLPFESSRGCWWGEKCQCAFCGLNAEGMAFRAKSPARVLAMLAGLQARYPSINRFFAADNNLPRRYYRELLPHLRGLAPNRQITYFYEIKSNVDRAMVKALADAGVRFVQPGIESLSSHLLHCLRKGVSALNNIHLLKLCRIYGVVPLWNFLIRVPGERAEDYHEMVRLLPAIVHYFPPAGGVRPIQVHRFSPYFRGEGNFLAGLRPQPWYAGLFPADEVDLAKVAYYFEARWLDTLGQGIEDYPEIDEGVAAWLQTWMTAATLPGLTWDPLSADGLELADTRFARSGLWRLDPEEAALYRAIDDPISLAQLASSEISQSIGSARVAAILDEFVAHRLAIKEKERYLGLALPAQVAFLPRKQRRDMYRRYSCGEHPEE